jgi:hypothetical protein
MKIIDARTGTEMKIGRKFAYPDRTAVTIIRSDFGLFTWKFYVMSTWIDPKTGSEVGEDGHGEGPVRYLHPSFMFQRVAFFPS